MFLPNSLTIPSPIPLEPPVTIVTFPLYLRLGEPAADMSRPCTVLFLIFQNKKVNCLRIWVWSKWDSIFTRRPRDVTSLSVGNAFMRMDWDQVFVLARIPGISHRWVWTAVEGCFHSCFQSFIMVVRGRMIACFLPLVLFSSSVHGFLDGLYCGTENCYDGRIMQFFFWFFLLHRVTILIWSHECT